MLGFGLLSAPVVGAAEPGSPERVMDTWYKVTLELVRHTPTYSPPVASRAFAYLGVAAYESIAGGTDEMQTLAGQLRDLAPLPVREADADYDDAVVVNAALGDLVYQLFFNTGPTGQHVMEAVGARLDKSLEAVPADTLARSEALGSAIAAHIFAWSEDDGGKVIENLGFPYEYQLTAGPDHWVPTSRIALQQTPLLPDWGENRTFAMPDGNACSLPPPPAYSEDKDSAFYREALEVYDTINNLTPEQSEIAQFWADDAMLTYTPPGHWIAIAMDAAETDGLDIRQRVDLFARLGIGLADAFIGCWYSKFEYDLVRPVTYINRLIDPDWGTIVVTPPFPEYPSGHSTQSGAAAEILTGVFGSDYAFADNTHDDDGMPGRTFASFWDAANEAGISRLYGGIHYRAAIERGLEQGRCIGAHALALKTWR
ncbi:MAG: vanadium-dependent haloperoxidase [Alphaproteobacteria bacterium]|nr:vanadium-dependent haloperoxidase [Alphaproteobacteria bacterium]